MVLRRTAIGPIRLDRLPRGKARRLKIEELERLRAASRKVDMRNPKSETAQPTT
jgi:16S rRNA U516 pseudouridylate synthase RsuA-like enzyme